MATSINTNYTSNHSIKQDKLGKVQFTRQQYEYLETVFPETVELGVPDPQLRERLGQRSVLHHIRQRVARSDPHDYLQG